jgi:prepilin-type N-terminal cleavage/methylation domain-containing protein
MKIKNILSSSKGFSLTEIMIAMGLLGALSMGVMKLMENSNKAAKNIESKDEISMMAREMSDILASANNCEESLRDKKVGNSVFFIKQVNKVTGVKTLVEKFNPIPDSVKNSKVVVESMRVSKVDANGTDGSQGIATLEVFFRKPKSGHLGARVVKKEITLSANLCNRDYITALTFANVMSQCSGLGKKLIEAPTQWPVGKWYAVCQDCTVAGYNKINFCQSEADGGVDVAAVSKLSCINMGGTFDDATQKCNLNDQTAKIACGTLGGVYNEASKICAIGDGVAKLQTKLCDFEKKFLGETMTGGSTTLCTPNVPVSGIGLVNAKHTKHDCNALGGSVMSDSAGKGFCKFNTSGGGSCPTGWFQYNGWINWNAQTFPGSSQGWREVCHHGCPGQACSVAAVPFSEYASRPQCNVGNCSFDCALCCTRTTNWVTKYASSSQIGCY